MSYLNLPAGIPNFSKAVISLWFRVPKESVIAAAGHSLPTVDENFLMMQSILPLVTYGTVQTNANYQLVYENIAHNPTEPIVVNQPTRWEPHTPYMVDPCFIGIECSSDGTFQLAFNIQMGDKGSYSSLIWFATSMDYLPDYPLGVAVPKGSGIVGSYYQSTIVDGSYGIQNAQNEFFYVKSDLDKMLLPDVWHHLLLSFDVSGSLAVGEHPNSACKLWYAIDDVDYRGAENMGPFRYVGDGLDPNTILTSNIYRESGVTPPESGSRLFFNNYVAEPSGSYSPGPIPSAGVKLGIPAASPYVDGIFRCEMAEFQMWTGVTLDTSITSKRRAFVDVDGLPVDPTGTEDDPAPAVKLLGKKPAILLHGSSNWQEGYNTGALGIKIEMIDGKETITKLPGGQFNPVAGIEEYKPDPSLEETTA